MILRAFINPGFRQAVNPQSWRVAGLEGWRWLFILEGIPAVILGIVTLFYLTDWPIQASWLPQEGRDWITGELNHEKKEKAAVRSYSIAEGLQQREVILLTLIYFLSTTGVYGFTIWFPTILKRASGLSIGSVSFLVALPYLAALIATLLTVGIPIEHRSGVGIPRALSSSAPVLCFSLSSPAPTSGCSGDSLRSLQLVFTLISPASGRCRRLLLASPPRRPPSV